MTNLRTIRLSTDLIGDTLYQAICHPGDHRRSTLVTSNREVIDADFVPLEERGLFPHPDYIQETEEGFRLLVPPNLPCWSEASLSQFAKGGLPPTTLRDHFNVIRSFLSDYVCLPDQMSYSLLSISVCLSYLIRIFPAVPLIQVEGPVGSGKSTLFNVLSKICRSGIFSSISTIAGLARARHLNPCTILIDEPLRDPNHPVILGSYKRSSTRLLAGPDQNLLQQNLSGFTFKVRDHASEAVKDRTIFLHITPADHRIPPFLPEREAERITRLIDHSLWLSLTQFQGVLAEYELFLKETSFTGRAAEKWAPVIAIARCIDSSDTAQEPITPSLEALMAVQVANQKSERLATDPSLLALAGTLAYLEHHQADLDAPSCAVLASDLANFVSEFAATCILPQRLSNLLGVTGALAKTWRTRATSSCVHPVPSKHPQTLYEIDLNRLNQALAIHGIHSEFEQKAKD